MTQHLPRRGRYEIFTIENRVYCFDDPTWYNWIPYQLEIHEWIRSHDPALWEPMSSDPDSNVALYLDPKLYMLFKLRWV